MHKTICANNRYCCWLFFLRLISCVIDKILFWGSWFSSLRFLLIQIVYSIYARFLTLVFVDSGFLSANAWLCIDVFFLLSFALSTFQWEGTRINFLQRSFREKRKSLNVVLVSSKFVNDQIDLFSIKMIQNWMKVQSNELRANRYSAVGESRRRMMSREYHWHLYPVPTTPVFYFTEPAISSSLATFFVSHFDPALISWHQSWLLHPR